LPIESDAISIEDLRCSVGRNYDPSFDWDGFRAIRAARPRELIVKGIARAVLPGRATLYGACAAGEPGALKLARAPNPGAVGADLLFPGIAKNVRNR
jgi:hypothetical protein